MQEAETETVQVTLMGPPGITKRGATDPAFERIKQDADAVGLMALLIVSLLTPKRAGPDPLKPNVELDADRAWLVEHFDPDLFARNPRQARDRFGYVLNALDDKLRFRTSPTGARKKREAGRGKADRNASERGTRKRGSSEYAVIGITLDHLSIDVRSILIAARQLHDEKNQDRVIARSAKRLLEGVAYSWLDRPVFQELRRSLDDCYLDALLRKIIGLRVKMESALALGSLDQANAYRTQALPLIEMGLARLRVLDASHPCATEFSELQTRFAHLVKVDAPSERDHAPPARALPRRVTSFVGREAEMAKLAELLATDRIVTITGIGGCGKTRLALQAAAKHVESVGGEAWLVELAGLTEPDAVPQAVADALGLPEQKQRTIVDTLIGHFQATRGLVVLDNCEHLLAGCAPLAETLAQSCPDVTILATSRQTLDIEGEYQFRLRPLRVPPTDPASFETPDPVATLLGYEAARLFVDRVRLHDDFPITPEHVLTIASICASLDGIPLALELAAARAAALSLAEIDELLADRFQLLTRGKSTSLPRHKTLRAVIDWSYDLLTEREQALLCRLSVFAGGWTLEGGRRVGASDDIEEQDVLDLLASLVSKSLVTHEAAISKGRYRMLETVRQYASDRLRERGERGGTHLRLWEYCYHLTQKAEPHLTGPAPGPWLDLLEAEVENLRVALSWCLMASEPEARASDFDRGARLVNALGWFWTVRGHIAEGRQWLDRVLDKTAGGPPSKERAVTLDWAGKLAARQGDYATAIPLLEKSVGTMRLIGDEIGTSGTLSNLGIILHGKGDYAGSQAALEGSLKIARSLGDQRGTANALNNLGTLAYDMCDCRQARAVLEESLAIYRAIRYREGIAHSLVNLGVVADYQGDYPAARALLEEGLAIHREMGDLQNGAEALMLLGINARNRGDDDDAHAQIEQGKAIFHQLGDRHHVAAACNALGFVAYYRNDIETAETLFQQGRALFQEISVPRGTVASLHGLGLVRREQGDDRNAIALFREGLAIAHQVGDKFGVIYLLEGIAASLAAIGRVDPATRLWGTSAALREQVGVPMPPHARERQDRSMIAARATLDNAAFEAALSSGRTLSWEQAVAEALDVRLA